MKQLSLLIFIMVMTNSCQSQDRIDLAQKNINDIKVQNLLSGEVNFTKEQGDLRWRRPNYLTYDMEKFRWGNLKFINNDHYQQNRLEIICDSTGSYPIVISIQVYQEEAASASKHIFEQLRSHYGEPVSLHEVDSQSIQFTDYFWKNVKEDQSIILCIHRSGLGDKPIDRMELFIIKNETDIVGSDYDYNDMNVLEYLVFQYSRWSMEKIKEVLQN